MKKILIVEDDQFLGEVLLEKLKNHGYDVLLARDGALGLQMIQKEKPLLVLLDMMLPTMSGYEILQAKFNDPLIKDIPVLVVSNSGQDVEIERIKDLGVTEYIVKVQFSPEEVMQKVDMLIGGPEETAVPNANNISTSGLKDVKILWVEDDQFLGELLARKLSAEGAHLFHATNGEEALTILNTEVPDIITLDIVLPGMNGLKTLEEIHKNEALSKIPVIMLSNLSQKEDVDKAFSLGAKKFLVKASYTLQEIIAEIKETLGRK